MRKLSFLAFAIVMSVFLSGCTLFPNKSSSEKKLKVNPDDKKTESPLEAKIIVGSLWKSSDGGNKFESKSKIDKEALALSQPDAEEGSEADAKESKPDDGRDEGSNGTIDDSAQTKAENENGDIISTADILSISFNPIKEKVIYVSTANDGLFMTEDGGELWKPVPFPPKNVYSFILDKKDPENRMFASGVVGDWGKIFRTKDGGKNWEEVYTEPGKKVPVTALAQHIKDTDIILAGTKVATVVKSIDSGETWKNVGLLEDYWDVCDSKNELGKKITGNVIDFAFDSKNKNVVYMATYGDKLYYSKTTGDRWIDWEVQKKREVDVMRCKKVNPDKIKAYQERMRKEAMPRGIVSIAADTTVPGLIYAGTNKGLFVSTSYGKWWNEVTIIESAKKYPIRSIVMNPKQPKEIVFVSEKAFYKSIDSGKTWATTGLDVDRDVSFVAYDPFDPNYLFVGLRNFKKSK